MLYELYEYSKRLRNSDSDAMAEDGFEKREFSFLIHIDENGEFIDLLDQRKEVENTTTSKQRKKNSQKRGTEFEVPRQQKRSGSKSYEVCNFLWDHIGYVLGIPSKGKEGESISQNQYDSWRNFLNNLPSDLKKDQGIRAMLKFYEKDQIERLKQDPNWGNFILKHPNTMFWLKGDSEPIPCRPAIKDYFRQTLLKNNTSSPDNNENSQESSQEEGICCITGQRGVLVKKHNGTRIKSGGGTVPECLISFQKNSGYDSYGKIQGYNAPIIESTSRGFTDAVNHLIGNSQQHVDFGESVVLFWAAEDESFIKLLKEALEESYSSTEADNSYLEDESEIEGSLDEFGNPNEGTEVVKDSLVSVFSGAFQQYAEDDSLFYVLTLAAGGGSRICVKNWIKAPVSQIARNIFQHFQDVEICFPSAKPRKLLPLKAFLAVTGKPLLSNKAGNKNKLIRYRGSFYEVTADLCSALLKAVLENHEYPRRLLKQAVLGFKMDSVRKRSKDKAATSKNASLYYEQASLIKACINRYLQKGRSLSGIKEKLPVALDEQNTDQSYLLGRLFAVLEYTQWLAYQKNTEDDSKQEKEVNSKTYSSRDFTNQYSLNSTLRERYYTSASTSPAIVFPRLLSRNKHYLAKLRKGNEKKQSMCNYLDQTIGEIVDKVETVGFPRFLTLEQQGCFAVGYYHQKYRRRSTNRLSDNEPTNNGSNG